MSLDWRNLPLEGRVLVEASAGTGKTWTLAMLYLRLLLEGGHAPEAIAVTTFTEAAAQELRGRIRARVREALDVLQGRPSGDAALDAYLSGLPTAPSRLAPRLKLALLDLDRAPIGTLHSLCLGVLREFPLLTGSDVLGLTLVDEPALRRALIDDIWRERMQSEQQADALTTWLLRKGRTFLQSTLPGLLQAGIEVRRPDAAALADCALLDEAARAPALRRLVDDGSLYRRANAAVRTELRKLAERLELGEDEAEANHKFPRLAEGHASLESLADQFADGALERLGGDPDFRFALRAGAAAMQARRLLGGAALAECRERLLGLRQQRLQQNRSIGYDDMVERVHAAVLAADGELAERLFARWPVALIDEFQDTDPRQYAIFDRLFRGADGRPRGCLLMVGDPKQAIYAFRGGDIHTYQRAAAASDQRLSLATNHRASREMVAALNELYAQGGDGFRIPPGPGHFGYVPVRPSNRRDDAPWRDDGRPLARPLRLHVLPSEDDPQKAPLRVERAIDSCAALIAETLTRGDQRIGDAPLHAGRIAVLLPRHSDVTAMREALRRRGIPSSGAGRSDVFTTEWARALQLQLWSWLNPEDGDALREVLRSPLYRWPLSALHPAAQDPGLLAAAHRANAAQAERWRRAGIQAAIGALVDARCADLLAEPGAGERALTDLRHLGELLAEAEAAGQRGEALWHWLAAQREQPTQDADTRQLRIESDGRRVRLMTLHASKGLEFDWVLLPLMWNHTPRSIDWPVAWDESAGQRVLDLGSPQWAEAAEAAARDDQRERLRVLYVALTRAVYRCDVWAMDPERLAHARARSPQDEAVRSALDLLLAPLFARPDAAALEQVAWLPGWPEGDARLGAESDASALPDWPPVPGAPVLDSLVSFSSLTHQRRSETRGAQDEVEAAADPEPAPPHPTLLEWEPLRGATVGNALHAILERRAIGRTLAEQPALVEACLREQGWPPAHRDAVWRARVTERLDAALDTDLGEGIRLAALPAAAQRAEMDFRMRLDAVSFARLKEALGDLGESRLLPASVPLRAVSGLLSGKIDLVFEHAGRLHVADYKSNRLGPAVDDYLGGSLERAMDHSGYRFQALLYTLAVHRYLRQRRRDYDPGTHLGESWYLFLRGMGLAPGAGVWRRPFEPALIEAVDAVFAGDAQ
ncbi:UvrD-helicase domain-containing protein [Pseudomarimonas salicorniae]|uniref:RecBCD enzyme subunit RecB n=1 Tax=Pseudomarimonas salicorniae TaxID=2933270 RepID=A0ABT0GE23_9GAMM|nr:UvrD-helicase domain-containing protein [Lysobacter sp. CAU 1642]MCK7592793.1 UvrD-helicase domain-containing protein [Lysobacter sp. CAU 1642]